MQRIMFFVIIFTTLINCSTRSSEADAPSADSLSNTIKGKLEITVPVRSFFKDGSITKLPSGDLSLKYLIPVAFYVDSGNFYIPDRSRSEIRILNRKGESVRSIKTGLKDIAFYKLARMDKHWYTLDINDGLRVFNENMKVIFGDEKTIDFHIDRKDDNVYFENMLNDRKAILDQKGLLKESFEIPYLSSYVSKSNLFGLRMLSYTEWKIEQIDLNSKAVVSSTPFKIGCGETCFTLPSLLKDDLIISSIQEPALNDQLSVVGTTEALKNFPLEYPVNVSTLISDESAGYTFSGFVYYYHSPSRILYSLCTDREFIRIFSFDLSLID